MAEYIDRESLVKNINQLGLTIYYMITQTPCAVPAADVVEVVRCKDCKYFGVLSGWCTFHDARIKYNDFCSYGAKMDGKGEQ